MADRPTVSDLVRTFQLRRRASTESFRAGVQLARTGVVTVAEVSDELVRADVSDPAPLPVELYVEDTTLVGRCPCQVAAQGICPHQVAVAHTLWVSGRTQSPGRTRPDS